MAWRVDSSQQVQAWESKLREDSLNSDPYSGFSGVLSEGEKLVPNAMTIVVPGVKRGENNRTISLLRALSSLGVGGRESQLGSEEEQVVISLQVFANTYSNAVNFEAYGIDGWDSSFYKIAEMIQPQLSRWHKEMAGRFQRQAMCELIDENLEKSPSSLTAGINRNTCFVDSDGMALVAFDSTLATYQAAIVTAAPTQNATNRFSYTALSKIITIAEQSEIEQFDVDGRAMWALMVPTRQKEFFYAPVADVGFPNIVKDAEVRGNNNRAISYVMGRFGPLLMVEDPRAPTVDIQAGPVVSFGYKGPGSTDGRDAAGTTIFDVMVLAGRGALYEYDLEPISFKEEIQDYQKNQGIAATRTTGWTIGEFDDLPSPTDASRFNKTSILFFAGTQ